MSQDFDFGSLDDGADGYLSNDRRHVFKLYGNYAITDTLRLGFNGTITSGRTPWTSTVDLQLAYMPRIANGKVTFQVDVFNVFNSQKAVEFNEVRDYSADTLSEGKLNLNYQQPSSFQSPRSVRLTARYEF